MSEDELGKVVEEMVHKCAVDRMIGWEQRLKLHVKPKPEWMPLALWAWIVNLVLVQSFQRRRSDQELRVIENDRPA